MKPVNLKDEGFENVIVLAESQNQYENLQAVEAEPGVLWTRWELTEEERAAVAAGARIDMFTHTFGQPFQPVNFRVESTPANVPLDKIPLEERPQGGL